MSKASLKPEYSISQFLPHFEEFEYLYLSEFLTWAYTIKTMIITYCKPLELAFTMSQKQAFTYLKMLIFQ